MLKAKQQYTFPDNIDYAESLKREISHIIAYIRI